MKKKFYSTLLFGIIFLSAYQSSLACRCFYDENPSLEYISEGYGKAIAVFSGEAVKTEIDKVKFKINQVWKGEIGDELVMSTGGKKIRDDLFQLPSSCDYNFQESRTYLVFAFGTDLEDMKATKCSLTNELKKASNTERLLNELVESKKKSQISQNGFLSHFKFTAYSPLFFPVFDNLRRD